MTCPMCSSEFGQEEARRGCKACPITAGCQIICCPNCGYRLPAEPPLVEALRRWWYNLSAGRGQAQPGPARPKDD